MLFVRLIRLVAIACIIVGLLLVSVGQRVYSQTDERCFEETGYCIHGRIREFWEHNDGIRVFGLPISAQFETIITGQPYQVQWFERNRLELHPENTAPYDVLTGHVGVDYARETNMPNTQPSETNVEDPDCALFEQTGHTVCGAFLDAWHASGLEIDGQPGTSYADSLALFGLPISEPLNLTMTDGQKHRVQMFERARFELHPENDPPYNVLFGMLGKELLAINPQQPQANPTDAATLPPATEVPPATLEPTLPPATEVPPATPEPTLPPATEVPPATPEPTLPPATEVPPATPEPTLPLAHTTIVEMPTELPAMQPTAAPGPSTPPLPTQPLLEDASIYSHAMQAATEQGISYGRSIHIQRVVDDFARVQVRPDNLALFPITYAFFHKEHGTWNLVAGYAMEETDWPDDIPMHMLPNADIETALVDLARRAVDMSLEHQQPNEYFYLLDRIDGNVARMRIVHKSHAKNIVYAPSTNMIAQYQQGEWIISIFGGIDKLGTNPF